MRGCVDLVACKRAPSGLFERAGAGILVGSWASARWRWCQPAHDRQLWVWTVADAFQQPAAWC
jgi:hypothetical protein